MQAIYGAIDRDRSGGSKVVRLDLWHLPWIVTGECTVSYPIVSGLHSRQQRRQCHRDMDRGACSICYPSTVPLLPIS